MAARTVTSAPVVAASVSALVVTADGFEDSEFTYPYYRLREAGVDVTTPGRRPRLRDARPRVRRRPLDSGRRGRRVRSPRRPGRGRPETLRTDAPEAADLVAAFDDANRPVAPIRHGVLLLISAGVVAGRYVTGYEALAVDVGNVGGCYVDEELVTDGNLVTSRNPEDLPAFGAEPIEHTRERASA